MVDWWTIGALLTGPVLAVQTQKWIERARESRQRKFNIFRTLMSTRDIESRISMEHVQALNLIDIEFYGRKLFIFNYRTNLDKEVVKAWKKYLDLLNSINQLRDSNGQISNDVFMKSDDLFISLLDKIAQSMGYDFDEIDLKRGIYKPEYYFKKRQYQALIENQLKEVLTGKQHISIKTVTDTMQPINNVTKHTKVEEKNLDKETENVR